MQVASPAHPPSPLPSKAPLPSAASGESRAPMLQNGTTAPLALHALGRLPHRRASQHDRAAALGPPWSASRAGEEMPPPLRSGLATDQAGRTAHGRPTSGRNFIFLLYSNSFKSQDLAPTSKICRNLYKNHKNAK
jgi:hypothetical protein